MRTSTSPHKENLFLENLSRYDFDETVEKLTEAIENKAWNVSIIHDLQQTLKKHGKEVLPVKVFAICQPKHSARILEKDYERLVSSVMPCRVSIYKKSDGRTYVSRMNTSMLAASFGDVIGQVMKESAAEVEEIISEFVL
jgi:uncharacterized protein (DUF302 family)